MNKINTLLISSIFANLSACGSHTNSILLSTTTPLPEGAARNAEIKRQWLDNYPNGSSESEESLDTKSSCSSSSSTQDLPCESRQGTMLALESSNLSKDEEVEAWMLQSTNVEFEQELPETNNSSSSDVVIKELPYYDQNSDLDPKKSRFSKLSQIKKSIINRYHYWKVHNYKSFKKPHIV